jgi:hypothetical protein
MQDRKALFVKSVDGEGRRRYRRRRVARQTVVLASLIALAGLCGAGVSVAMTAKQGSQAPVSSQAHAADGDTQIIADEVTKTVRVLIGGREVAVIDADGLRVRGNIRYAGTLTDVGEETEPAHGGDAGRQLCDDRGLCGKGGAGP